MGPLVWLRGGVGTIIIEFTLGGAYTQPVLVNGNTGLRQQIKRDNKQRMYEPSGALLFGA
jgi:hypothetical protein